MSESFLQIRGLKKHFGTKRVLDGIDLDIARASVTTIIGKSGIGKSVFLKCIANLMAPDAGEILLDGVSMGSNRRAADQSEGFTFSYMFQNNALFDSLTAFENVALPLREVVGLPTEAVAERVTELLEQLDLGEAGSRYPAELSGGMQKRVALARALVTNPEVVLFDEPTTGLDPERKFGVFDMISDYRERFGFTALLVSHDIPEVFEISDKVAWLDEGKIRFFGDPSELAADSPRSWSGLLQSSESVEKS
ncbi:MAG: ATP-binding cassette domain-containing protein [Verrucomicrobia bacterium]|nr:ATP-binding cassette domain-containing protein [Verrucomicrobiota bacterium]